MPRVVKGERPGLVFKHLLRGFRVRLGTRMSPVSWKWWVCLTWAQVRRPILSSLDEGWWPRWYSVSTEFPPPDFAVLYGPHIEPPDLAYPLIVKPRSEAVSFGIKIVNDDDELKEARIGYF